MTHTQQKRLRLSALDGLRGLAIALVMLNHLPFNYRPFPIPWVLNDIINKAVFGNGQLGVQMFFILSGFLMVYLYFKPKSVIGFIQKRYTRIFPALITICLVEIIIRSTGRAYSFLYIAIALICAVIVHIAWVYVIKPHFSATGKRAILVGFLMLQGVVGLVYAIATIWKGFSPFILALPPFLQNVGLFLINSTLTFQFGANNSWLIINGVLWSLACEIMFYLLYPTICAPFIRYMATKKRVLKIVILLLLMPMVYCGYKILDGVLGFHMLTLYTVYYFIAGMTLGYLYRKKSKVIMVVGSVLNGKLYYVPLMLLIVTLAGNHFLMENLYLSFHVPREFTQVLFAIPATFMFVMTLYPDNLLAKIFSSKGFVFMGTISYSLYLTHVIVIFDIFYKTFPSKNRLEDYAFIVIAFLVSVRFASIMYVLLERPYFSKVAHRPGVVRSNKWPLVSESGAG